MRDDIVGTRTDWEPVPLEPATLRLFLEATALDVAPYVSADDGDLGVLPAAALAALRPDADALGVPVDAPVRLNAGNRFVWHQQVPAGTLLQRQTWVADAYEKTGRSGRLEFYVLNSAFREADTEAVVAEAQATTIRRYPQDQQASPSKPAKAVQDPAPVADQLSPRTFAPSSRQLVKYSVATGDYYEAHYDHLYATEHGLPGVIVHGLLKLCLCNRALHDWFGRDLLVNAIDVQYRGLDLVGTPWTVHGEVTADPDNAGQTGIRLTGRSVEGKPTLTGTAILCRPISPDSTGTSTSTAGADRSGES